MKNQNTQDDCCSEVVVHEELLKIVNEMMPEETELYDLAELFKVFGDSTRIRILFVLFEAEDRERFDEVLTQAHIPRPKGISVTSQEEAISGAADIGYPVMV